jgi:cell division protein ZapE
MQPADRYKSLVAEGKLTGDPEQEAVAAALDRLAYALAGYEPDKKSFLGLGKPPTPPRGLYIHGPVGRGKSMLMDMFFATVDFAPKRRTHFHDFMGRVHRDVKHWRDSEPGDPIPRVAAAIRAETALLCFDEFQVSDITDAMILGRLFDALFDLGVVVVATSNRHPRELYENGINRQLFLPAIDLIETRMQVLKLDGPIDYRLARLERSRVYFTPPGKDADAALNEIWHDLTGVARGAPGELEILGRKLAVPEQSKGVARFTFDELCATALGAQDYLALADNFHALILRGIPQLTADQRNEAKRFVTLIDALYERSVKLVCSAAAAPADLYRAGDGTFEFERAASRLMEMQTPDYLARLHNPKKT